MVGTEGGREGDEEELGLGELKGVIERMERVKEDANAIERKKERI